MANLNNNFLNILLNQLMIETNPNVVRARKMRPFAMENPNKTYSSHKMESADNKVYPTIFPPSIPSSNPKDWIDLSNIPREDSSAFEKAISLNEVLSFGTEEQAREFALEGSWKPKNIYNNPSSYWQDLLLSTIDLLNNGKSKP